MTNADVYFAHTTIAVAKIRDYLLSKLWSMQCYFQMTYSEVVYSVTLALTFNFYCVWQEQD